MLMTLWIVVTAGAGSVRGSAIAIFMHVNGVFSAWLKALHVRHDFYFAVLFIEVDYAMSFVALRGMEHGDGMVYLFPLLGVLFLFLVMISEDGRNEKCGKYETDCRCDFIHWDSSY